MTVLEECQNALGSVNVTAFLRVIRAGESSQTDDAYRMMFGGAKFDSFDAHPNIAHTSGHLTSTAAGAYQFLFKTWTGIVEAIHLPDFSPLMQDIGAVYLIRGRGALGDVLAGRVGTAISKCCREWASLPGSPYGQPTRTLAQALATYAQYGGTSDAQPGGQIDTSPRPVEKTPEIVHVEQPAPAPAPKGSFMAPIIAALLPSLIDAIPKLGALFAKSDTAKTNVKAAEIAFSVAKEALGATNEQEVIARVQSDPAAAAIVNKAIEDNWFQLTDAGGGGIDGARKADAASRAAGDMLHSPSFWMASALLLLVFWMMGNVMGLYGAPMDEKVRSAIINGAQGMILGGIVGYFFGQTTSRNRTPA